MYRLTPQRIVAGAVALAVIPALGACGGAASGDDASEGTYSLTLGLNYVATVEHYGPYYALEEGVFADNGLDVTLQPGGDTPPSTLLAAGQVDVAVLDTIGMLQAIDEGEDFVAIATEYQMSPTSMTCRADSGIESPDQIAGATLGLKTSATDYLPIILASVGLTEDDLTIVPIGNQDVSALIAGQVDCMFSSFAFNEPRTITDAGVEVNVFPMSELGLPTQANVYVTTRDNLDDPEFRAAAVALVASLSSAWGTFLDDPAAAATYMVDNAFADGLELEQQTFQAETQASYISTPFTQEAGLLALDVDAWQSTAQTIADMGITSTYIDPEPAIDDLTGDAGSPQR